MNKQVEIFTDGSCLGNPGPGGYGIIIKYAKNKEIFFSGGYYITTNNRMEIIANIIALKNLENKYKNVTITTDSKYVYQGILTWIHYWKKFRWLNSKKKPVKNIDLWKKLDILIVNYSITWKWIKSHAGHKENEKCDLLARSAAKNPTFHDLGYKTFT